jgi:selenocysteine lyase/cysteine desulfurase
LREDFLVEVPVTSFAGRPWLRFSVQGYNTREDIARLVEAVGELLG